MNIRNRYLLLTLIGVGLIVISSFGSQQNPENGLELYQQHCQSCHMKKGKGFFKIYPPLTDTTWVGKDEKIVSIILNGLSGQISVNGKTYNNEMPPMAYLTDEEVAKIINYIRKKVVGMERVISARGVNELSGKKK